MEIQNRIVFAVELEFTSTSPWPRAREGPTLGPYLSLLLFGVDRFAFSGFIDKAF